jgi:Fe2+ transport system protein FeoA
VVTKLCCAKKGDICKILKVEGNIRCRLSELGFSPNEVIRVVNHNSKNSPISVQIRDFCIALRHCEAECIEVEII